MSVKTTLRTALVLLALGMAGTAHASLDFNMPKGATEISHEVYGLHMLIFWICVAIGVLVFGVMIYSLIYHRKSKGAEAAQFHESTAVEIIWTILPFIILVAMAIPAAGTLIKMEDTRNSDMTIKITGYQWLWHYNYLDNGVQFFSRLDADSNRARQLNSGISPGSVDHYLRSVDNRMVVPVGEKIRILLTSKDVIHAWWVPALGGKKDAIPGYINEIWIKVDQPGVYRGQCAELCGRGHAYMPIVVEAVPQKQFNSWVKEQGGHLAGGSAESGGQQQAGGSPKVMASAGGTAPAPGAEDSAETSGSEAAETSAKKMSKADLMAQGKQVYQANCAACHQADGSGMKAAGFPALKGSAVATGPIPAHIGQVLNGKNAMPPFGGSLNDSQVAAVVTYERNAFGNNTGDVVQPAQVKAQR